MTKIKPIAVTMGEPAGIGGEITLKTWLRRKEHGTPFIAVDNLDRLRKISKKLLIDLPLIKIEDPGMAIDIFEDALPVYPIDLPNPPKLGVLDQANSKSAIKSIKTAFSLAKKGTVSAIVTNPINKKIVYEGGFNHPGHTEYLAALSEIRSEPVMMLACDAFRTVPITTHCSLREALNKLSEESIVSQSLTTAIALKQDFGIANPRLAFAGLNPHAGENGTMGDEEQRIIAPAIKVLKNQGLTVFGPLPPDTMFSRDKRSKYDAAICMYHDQALIPIKTLNFSKAVNITLGLPIIRTSPDHGTALDIAAKGTADESSLIAALGLAANIARIRGSNIT